jgi:ADP-ribosylglycohydrolase
MYFFYCCMMIVSSLVAADPIVDLVTLDRALHSVALPVIKKDCTTVHDRIRGAIVASALGDAMGNVSEFSFNYDDLQKKLMASNAFSINLSVLVDNYMINGKFIYTDDTIMARPVLESCYQGRFDNSSNNIIMSAIAHGFVTWVSPETDEYYGDRAHGATAPNVVAQLKKSPNYGKPDTLWWKQGYTTYSLKSYQAHNMPGCGSVMRVWPIGLLFFDDINRIEWLAIEQSRITHPLPEADAASAAMAVGMAYAVRGASVDTILQAMIDCALKNQKYSQAMPKHDFADTIDSDGIKSFKNDLMGNRLTVADMLIYVKKLYALGKDNPISSPAVVLGNISDQAAGRSTTGALLGWTAGEAVAAAAYIFMRHATGKPEDTWKGLQEAVWTVGDSDSIATLAGAMLGAYQGFVCPESDKKALAKLENLAMFEQLSNDITKLVCPALQQLL